MEEYRQEDHYTYADYMTWDDGKRYEIINGIAYMVPAPTTGHQTIALQLALQIGNFLRGKPCKLFIAPFDVRLNLDEADDIVVQPDLVVLCGKSKLENTGCKGAPDMIVEVLSPATANRDKVTKFDAYLRAGVREYWIVSPEDKTVQVCILENGKYVLTSYGETGVAPVSVLDGCTINMAEVFAE